jgi:hypothetical protein
VLCCGGLSGPISIQSAFRRSGSGFAIGIRSNLLSPAAG